MWQKKQLWSSFLRWFTKDLVSDENVRELKYYTSNPQSRLCVTVSESKYFINAFSVLLWTAFTLETRVLTYDDSYYEYVPDRRQWSDAGKLCNQRSGALATVANSAENMNLARFLKSLNISQPVWIAGKVRTYLTSRYNVSSVVLCSRTFWEAIWTVDSLFLFCPTCISVILLSKQKGSYCHKAPSATVNKYFPSLQ